MQFVGCVGAEVELPGLRAREAVRGAVGAWALRRGRARAKPREDDGDAAADGFAGSERGLLRKEEHRLFIRRLPGGDVRALQVELAGAGRGCDAGANEAGVFIEGENAWDGEGGVELIV